MNCLTVHVWCRISGVVKFVLETRVKSSTVEIKAVGVKSWEVNTRSQSVTRVAQIGRAGLRRS